MTAIPSPRLLPSLALVLAGAAAAGASLAAPWGAARMLSEAVNLPVLLLGVPLLMLPSLYLASGLAGVPLSIREANVSATLTEATRRLGVAWLCFAPVMLFLSVSIDFWAARVLLQWSALGLCAAAALCVVRDALSPGPAPRAGLAVFVLWGACVVAIQAGLRASWS